MKRTENEFKAYVKNIRSTMPSYNAGRSVVVLSEYSQSGKQIIADASRYEGTDLRQVYGRWSSSKQEAFDEVWDMYHNTPGAEAFGICSYNSMMFTVSWVEPGVIHYLTSHTEYIVLCNE